MTRVASGEIDLQIDWEPAFEVFSQVRDVFLKFGKPGEPKSIDWSAIVGDHHYFDGIKSACFPPLCDETDFERLFEEFHFIKPVDEPGTPSDRLYLYLETDKREMVVQEFVRFLEHLKGLKVLQDAGIVYDRK